MYNHCGVLPHEERPDKEDRNKDYIRTYARTNFENSIVLIMSLCDTMCVVFAVGMVRRLKLLKIGSLTVPGDSYCICVCA